MLFAILKVEVSREAHILRNKVVMHWVGLPRLSFCKTRHYVTANPHQGQHDGGATLDFQNSRLLMRAKETGRADAGKSLRFVSICPGDQRSVSSKGKSWEDVVHAHRASHTRQLS